MADRTAQKDLIQAPDYSGQTSLNVRKKLNLWQMLCVVVESWFFFETSFSSLRLVISCGSFSAASVLCPMQCRATFLPPFLPLHNVLICPMSLVSCRYKHVGCSGKFFTRKVSETYFQEITECMNWNSMILFMIFFWQRFYTVVTYCSTPHLIVHTRVRVPVCRICKLKWQF